MIAYGESGLWPGASRWSCAHALPHPTPPSGTTPRLPGTTHTKGQTSPGYPTEQEPRKLARPPGCEGGRAAWPGPVPRHACDFRLAFATRRERPPEQDNATRRHGEGRALRRDSQDKSRGSAYPDSSLSHGCGRRYASLQPRPNGWVWRARCGMQTRGVDRRGGWICASQTSFATAVFQHAASHHYLDRNSYLEMLGLLLAGQVGCASRSPWRDAQRSLRGKPEDVTSATSAAHPGAWQIASARPPACGSLPSTASPATLALAPRYLLACCMPFLKLFRCPALSTVRKTEGPSGPTGTTPRAAPIAMLATLRRCQFWLPQKPALVLPLETPAPAPVPTSPSRVSAWRSPRFENWGLRTGSTGTALCCRQQPT